MKKVVHLITILLLVLAFSLAACGGGGEASSQPSSQSSGGSTEVQGPTGDAATGAEKFASICSACHGPEGEGVPGLGKDMTASEFIAGKTDVELVEFIKVGREVGDPLNTTGVAMPPRGGNPAFTDQDLYDIVAHVRTLQK
jgi:disulfide bond formation protein DsbB